MEVTGLHTVANLQQHAHYWSTCVDLISVKCLLLLFL